MGRKNNLPIKLFLGGAVALLALVYWQIQSSKNNGTTSLPHTPTQNQLSSQGSATNMAPSTNNPSSSPLSSASTSNGQNLNGNPSQNLSASSSGSSTGPMATNTGNSNPALSSTNNANVSEATVPETAVANPIPSDAEVAARVNTLNQRHDEAYAVLVQRGAMATEVMKAAEGQNQKVIAQNIPAPYTGPAPADVVAKLKTNQVFAAR